MLNIYGRGHRFCDGISRRGFLKIGGFTFGAASLSLADVLRAEAASPVRGKRGHKAVINVFLGGGPPHQDMWEIKTDAPAEIRGEFKPINTKVDGIQIGEAFPRIAGMMDRFAVIRSVVGNAGDHDGYQCLSGWPRQALAGQGGYPSIGSVLAKIRGPIDRAVPPSIGLAAKTQHTPWSEAGTSGFLGPAYYPFRPNLLPAGGDQGHDVIKLNGLTLDRLQDRRRLLSALDSHRRDLDASLDVQARDAASEAAFDLLTSSKLADALDVTKEDTKTRERYGDGKPYKYQYDGAPTCNDQLLIARRLVEAGVRCVSLSYGRWDSHGQNFDLVRDHGGKLDQCLSALVEDLEQRGMLDDVTVIAWGEFGRTPQINKDAGRDHWPQVSCAIMAGGGMKTGQAIGRTDRTGAFAEERPVHVQDIIATIYHNLGVNLEATMLDDRTGRPQYLLDHRDPIQELVG
ncbi:MAG: hypothetical protein K0Q72_1607 [Armatimonadetes bacterium]|jgi:uncharacterized protein (DUF1501 family)|nr:hypothetical protein [Armatimonadota bacterium]